MLTRLSTEILFHPFQPFIIGQKLIAEKIANQYDIPLIFYGENEAEYGNPLSENDSSLRDKKFASTTDFESIVLGGVSVADLRSYFGLDDSDLAFYLPLDQRDLHEKGSRRTIWAITSAGTRSPATTIVLRMVVLRQLQSTHQHIQNTIVSTTKSMTFGILPLALNLGSAARHTTLPEFAQVT